MIDKVCKKFVDLHVSINVLEHFIELSITTGPGIGVTRLKYSATSLISLINSYQLG